MTGAFRGLAIDTASDVPSVAACSDEAIVERRIDDGARTERIFSYVDDVLAELGVALADLDCIGVGRGPGSFTGLRVGMAAAQALAFGANLPICPVSSLGALALGAGRRAGSIHVVAALDARMGEVYAGGYRINGDTAVVTDPDVVSAPDRLRLGGTAPFVAAGPGWGAFPELQALFSERIQCLDVEARPDAADVLRLAREAFRQGDIHNPTDVLPVYLRDRVTS
jgi:tRNA threonylcarbamoyladenosine biosynthesis protein TsaB